MDEQVTDKQSTDTLIHAALLYHGPGALSAALERFVGEGLGAGEPALVVLPPASLELAQRALSHHNGQVRYEDMAELGGNPCRLLALFQDWIDGHDGAVRVVGEPVYAGRSYAETVECLRHEALLNEEFAHAPASILCPYDADGLDADTLAGAELTHPFLLGEDGVRRDSAGYGEPLDVAGAARWPQAAPIEPVSEHRFSGDLRALRHGLGDDPLLEALAPTRRQDLVFAINEAATNAVKHGDGNCRTRLWRDGEELVTEIVTETDLADAFAGRRRPPDESLSGRGLWLINQVCDLVELRSAEHVTSLRLHMHVAS